MKDTSLMLYKEKRVPRIIQFVKSLLVKQSKAVQKAQFEVKVETNEVDEFAVLKNFMEGKIDISQIDNETKKRLICICNDRLEGIKKQINDKSNKIKQMEGLLADINVLQMDNV